MIEQFPSF